MKLQNFFCSSEISLIQGQLSSNGNLVAVVVTFRLFLLSKARFSMAVSITERFMQEFIYDRPVGEKKDRIVKRTAFVKVRVYFPEERREKREDTGNQDGCLRK